MKSLNIYWSRRDFRLRDNPALHFAIAASNNDGADFLPLFILENYMTTGDPKFQFGYPARHMIAHAIPDFAKQFNEFLTIKGRGADTIISLTKALRAHYDAITVHANEDVYPDFYKQVKKLQKHSIDITIYKDRLTIPHDTKTGSGNFYSVFTPFRNAVWNTFISTKTHPKPHLEKVSYPRKQILSSIKHVIHNDTEHIWNEFNHARTLLVHGHEMLLDKLLPTPRAYEMWYTNEHDALLHFKLYLNKHLTDYKQDRDSLGLNRTSRMSTALAWGFVSARTLTHMILKHFEYAFDNPYAAHYIGGIHFISELIWREFYAYLFFHNPDLLNIEFQAKFRNTIKWDYSKEGIQHFESWIKGETGYPVVDAAMKELAQTGHMHNRARMVVSSFLAKHLGIDWRWGQEYFRAMLIDIDEASNCGGWQWGASVGADPKPIRIFNPTLQAKNYDPDNAYQKRWLGDNFNPKTYIPPIVDHNEARKNAVMRYKVTKISHVI